MNTRESDAAEDTNAVLRIGGDALEEAADGDGEASRATRRGVLGRLGALAAATSGALAFPATVKAAGPPTVVTVGTHGTGFHVEDVTGTYSVVPRGSGLAIKGWKAGNAPTILWVHAVLPTLAVWQKISPTKRVRDVRVSEWRIRFSTSGGSNQQHVSNWRMWDGPKQIASAGGLNVKGPSLSGGFAKPVPLQHYALALSIGVRMPSAFDTGPNTPPPPAFLFSFAEATLTVRGL
jgi:hypothetical protein